jgi:putative Mg2+ transporter-C (MgtC) family protein
MTTVLNYDILFSLLLAVGLGGVVGIDREISHKPAGLRTHMLVCLGSCLFTIVSIGFNMDPARIAAGIVTGIGFIGAGTIWAEKDKVQGITTAASLWATAAIGLATGLGDFPLASTVAFLVFLILALRHFMKRVGMEQQNT